ncbi:hypothetical protein ACFLXC_06355 [Chloroflexota bacterium]
MDFTVLSNPFIGAQPPAININIRIIEITGFKLFKDTPIAAEKMFAYDAII